MKRLAVTHENAIKIYLVDQIRGLDDWYELPHCNGKEHNAREFERAQSAEFIAIGRKTAGSPERKELIRALAHTPRKRKASDGSTSGYSSGRVSAKRATAAPVDTAVANSERHRLVMKRFAATPIRPIPINRGVYFVVRRICAIRLPNLNQTYSTVISCQSAILLRCTALRYRHRSAARTIEIIALTF